jgi:hypothetical protein
VFATLAASLLVTPYSANAAELPRANCTKRLIDPSGDSFIQQSTPTNVDGLDLTSVLMRLTADEIQVFLQYKDLKMPAEMGPLDGAYQYKFGAKYGEKNLTFMKYVKSGAAPWSTVQGESTASQTRGDIGPVDGGAGKPLTGWTATFDYTNNYLIFAAPRAILETLYEETLPDGAKFEKIVVEGVHYTGTPQRVADQLSLTADKAFFVLDDYCFGPPPGQLTDLVTPAVQFGDTAQLKAKLANEAGEALAGKEVQFTVGTAAPVKGTTGADGVATAPFPASLVAGKHPVVAQFLGDTEVGKAKLTGEITISAEKTLFKTPTVGKPSATTRHVTAQLVDDDGKPVPGVKVDWYVNGKKVSTLTSDANGKTVLKTAKPTQTVYAKFVGVTGKYLAATSKSIKLT